MCTNCGQSKKTGIPRVIQKATNILEGYKSIFVYDEVTEANADMRMNICLQCDKCRSALKINDKHVWVCGICKCPLAAKTRSNEHCDLGKW